MATPTSTIPQSITFNAPSLLKLDTYSHCVGYAPSQGRRCYNPISRADQADACRRFRALPRYADDAAALLGEVEELAHLCLCKRNHQTQIRVVAGRWMSTIQTEINRQRQEHARGAQRVSVSPTIRQPSQQRILPTANNQRQITLPTVQDVQSTTIASLANGNTGALDVLIESLESIRAAVLSAQIQQPASFAAPTQAVVQTVSTVRRVTAISATRRTAELPPTASTGLTVTTTTSVHAPDVQTTSIPLQSRQTNSTAVSITHPLPAPASAAAPSPEEPGNGTPASRTPTPQVPSVARPLHSHPSSRIHAPHSSSSTPQRYPIPADQSCTICLDRHTDPVRTPCGHFYCRECITTWLSDHFTCPEDRRRLHSTQLTPIQLIRRRPIEGECSICYEEYTDGDREDGMVFCQAECGQNFHASCFERWRVTSEVSGGESMGVVLCPYCRTRWED